MCVAIFVMPSSNSHCFHEPRWYAPTVIWLFKEGSGGIQGAECSPRQPCGKRIGWICAKLLIFFLLNDATFFTAGEEGSIVTHNGSVITSKKALTNCQ